MLDEMREELKAFINLMLAAWYRFVAERRSLKLTAE
jgi:hypothetical protein